MNTGCNNETQFEAFLCGTTLQTSMPAVGDTIAIIKTNHGDVIVRFFPEEAPLAVENFITHARNGYYDGLTFHRVIPGFMIQGGDPNGNGTGGQSIWGRGFEDEVHPELNHLRGALSMANAGPMTNGSQFFIVQNQGIAAWWPNEAAEIQRSIDNENHRTTIRAASTLEAYRLRDRYPLRHLEFFLEHGGTPTLDTPGFNTTSVHTVFGMVISGMDIVDLIANVPTNPANDRPIEPVVILSIEITEFRGN
ncbi:MAG: peptidylprolyl isomerase [Defluviitaleaceae bacterium]|nr:peptidylprolyl isomerase [Defluviitaleaceae bacterium]